MDEDNFDVMVKVTLILIYTTYPNVTLGVCRTFGFYYTMLKNQHVIIYKWKKDKNKKKPWTLKYTWLGNIKVLSIIAVLVWIGVEVFYLCVLYLDIRVCI